MNVYRTISIEWFPCDLLHIRPSPLSYISFTNFGNKNVVKPFSSEIESCHSFTPSNICIWIALTTRIPSAWDWYWHSYPPKDPNMNESMQFPGDTSLFSFQCILDGLPSISHATSAIVGESSKWPCWMLYKKNVNFRVTEKARRNICLSACAYRMPVTTYSDMATGTVFGQCRFHFL